MNIDVSTLKRGDIVKTKEFKRQNFKLNKKGKICVKTISSIFQDDEGDYAIDFKDGSEWFFATNGEAREDVRKGKLFEKILEVL